MIRKENKQMKMKKLVVSLALAALMFTSPAMAISEQIQEDYFNNGAVEMQYMQTQLPVQTYIQGADFVATDVFTASADLVVLQALPQTQKMSGTANGGYQTMNASHQVNTQLQFNGALAIGGYAASVSGVRPVNYGYYDYYYTMSASANDYGYYYNNEGEYWTDDNGLNYAMAASLYYNKSVYDYINTFSTLPASGEMGATQSAMNQTVLQTPNMLLQMTQISTQGGFLNMTGHGIQNGGSVCD